jgi:hypothetical protein
MRVLAEHPDAAENAKPDVEIETSAWRLVSLTVPKPDGGTLEVETLWPAAVLCGKGITVGSVVGAAQTEIETTGEGLVTEIGPCPEIEAGPGRIVTSTYKHSAANVLDLSLTGDATHSSETVGTTANHPFWSEDRREFVPAGDLKTGERLRRADGSVTTVASLASRGERLVVYNLEVDAEHVYHVGTGGTRVHNNNQCGMHGYAIINRITGVVYKFGVSKTGFQASGLSARAQSQLTTIAAKNGVARSDLESVVLRSFTNRADMFRWERETVGFWRTLNKTNLPDNILPNGTPF